MYKVVKEVGSGVNDSRRKLLAILTDPTITVIVVEHKDRLTRFGFRYIETLLAVQGRRIEVVNVSEDLMADLVSISYSFCSRLAGQRRAKRKTEKIVKALENQKTASNDNHFDERKKEEVKEKIAERGKPS